MMKRTLALIALLTFFSPFLAAQGRFELVGEVMSVTGDPPVVLSVEVEPGAGTLDIRVEGLDFTGIDLEEPVNVWLEGIFTLGASNISVPRATDIAPAEEGSANELTGRIVDIDVTNHEITLRGGWVISVGDAEIKDLYKNPLVLCDSACPDNVLKLEDFVFALLDPLEDSFTATEINIVEELVCPQGAAPTHVHVFEEGLYEDGEDFCLQTNRRGETTLQGRVRITRTEYDGDGEWDATITVGRYAQNQRQGLWITLSEAGSVRLECVYVLDTLVPELLDGENGCPFIDFE